jgi:DNA-binding transcriptional regulator YiaG
VSMPAAIEEVQELARVRRLLRSGQAQLIRREADVSQGDVARALGVAPATVSRWEAGTRIPRGQIARNYGRLLEGLSS